MRVSSGRDEPASHFYLQGIRCDGDLHRWSATAHAYDGIPFLGGRGTVDAILVAAGDLASSIAEASQTVRGVPAR
jgi:hypothetical protein